MRRSVGYKILASVALVVLFDACFGLVAKRLVPPQDVVTLMAQERLYRVRSPFYHHDLAKGASVVGGWGPRRHPIYTNSLGFKAASAEQVPLRTDRHRLLFIGDSFTEGIGVEYPQTFVGQVALALAPDGVEVLNAAVASYSPVIYYRKLKYWIEERGLKVDHVVVFVDVSDIEDEALFYELENDRVIDRKDSPIHSLPTLDTIDTVPARPFKEEVILSSLVLRTGYAIRAALRPPDAPNAPGMRLGFLGGAPRGIWTYDDASYERFGRRGSELARQH